MVKRVIRATLFFTLILLGASEAQATEVGNGRRFGLGFQLGDPTAIIGKLFLGGGNAFDFGVGFDGYGRGYCWDEGRRRRCWDDDYGFDHMSLHADYLWQENIVRGTAQLDWHIGVGGRMWIWDDGPQDDDVWLGARMPVGLDLTFNRPSFLEVFFEIAPTLMIFPFVDLDLEAAIGVRFYF
jgi:hypothetical protein